MFDADGVAMVAVLSAGIGFWLGRGIGLAKGSQVVSDRLRRIAERSIEKADESAKEVAGARMTVHKLEREKVSLQRLAGFWRPPDEAPAEGAAVVVLRDAGVVGNGLHPGHRTGRWLEFTTSSGGMFFCDVVSTGNAIGWIPADELLGIEALSKDAERYRYMRDFPYNNIARAVGITNGRHFWLQFDEADKAVDKAMRDDANLLACMDEEARHDA